MGERRDVPAQGEGRGRSHCVTRCGFRSMNLDVATFRRIEAEAARLSAERGRRVPLVAVVRLAVGTLRRGVV